MKIVSISIQLSLMKALTPPRLMIVAAAALSVLPSCRKSPQAQANSEWWELEAKRVQLVHKIEVLKVRQSKIDTARREQAMVQEDSALTAGYRSDLKQYAGQLRDAMAEQREEMAALRSEWIRKTRLDAVGRTFDTLAGTDGKTFQHAVITRVTDVGVEFRHSTGTARLAANQLSAEQQDAFALDTAVAYEAIQEENALASDFASWVDQGVADAAYREEVRQQALQEEERENQRLLSASTPAPARSSALHSAPRSALREEARAFGNGGSIWYPYYRTYRTHYYYVPSRACYTVPSIYRASSVPSVRSSPPNWSYSPR